VVDLLLDGLVLFVAAVAFVYAVKRLFAAAFAFAVLAGVIVFLRMLLPIRVAYRFEWSAVTDNIGPLADGLFLTIRLSVGGMAVALVLGLVVAVLRMSRSPFLAVPANVFIQVLRGVPLIIFIFWIYYGVARIFGIAFTSSVAGIISLGLTGAAYMAEVYRGGLQAIDPGQREAGLAMGLGRLDAFARIVMPQALRIVLPPTVNVFVGLLKGATILGVIGVADMLYFARLEALRTAKPFELYTVAGLALVATTVAIAGFAGLLERRLGRGVRVG